MQKTVFTTRTRKLLSALLALAIVFSLFAAVPMTAGAADAQCEINGNQYDFGNALGVVKNGETIKLLQTITYSDTISIDGKSVTFDLNGYTLIINAAVLGLEVINGGSLLLANPKNGQFNIIATGPVMAGSGCKAEVTNVNCTDYNGYYGALANGTGAEVIVYGNVNLIETKPNYSNGVIARDGGKIIVEGTITVPESTRYLKIQSADKKKTDGLPSVSRPGYLEYTDGTSTVWVKDPNAAPAITGHPSNLTVAVGEGISFSVEAIGHNLGYQWQRSTDNGRTWSNLTTDFGSKNPYTVQASTVDLNGYQYRCVVSNALGSVTSNAATLTVRVVFVPVTDITGVPATASVGKPLTLTGTVTPATATNQTITWRVASAGRTGARITGGNTFNATAEGTATVTATIANGLTATTNFTKTFTIIVTGAPTITGPATMTLEQGYAAASSAAFTITGAPAPTVTKTYGDSKITWNSGTKKLDIAAGLAAGTYTVTLKAANGKTPDATCTFTLTVTAVTGGMAHFARTRTYAPGMFTDINENDWWGFNHLRFIATAYEYNLVNGMGATTFAPTDDFTVIQAIALAARLHSIYATGRDIVQGELWYRAFLDYAVAHGIVAANEFTNLDRACTRAEMAYLFSRSLPAEELRAQNTVKSLPDVDNSTQHRDEIIMLYRAGVISGNDNRGTFTPNSNMTRAHAAGIINNIILPASRGSGKTFG